MTDVLKETHEILGHLQSAYDAGATIDVEAPLPTIRESLEQARTGLLAAEATFRTFYENKAVPSGIAGADYSKTRDLVGEVDRLLASVDNYYLETTDERPDHPTKPR